MGADSSSEERKQGGPAKTHEEEAHEAYFNLSCVGRGAALSCDCERKEGDSETFEDAERGGADPEQQQIADNKSELEAKLKEAGSNIGITFRLLDADRYLTHDVVHSLWPSLTTCRTPRSILITAQWC